MNNSHVTTFVSVHDQESVDQSLEQLDFMPNLTLLYLGSKPAAVPDGTVVCVDYNEDHPNLYDFSGFRTLVKHNLIRTECSIFLQYDHRVDVDNISRPVPLTFVPIIRALKDDPGMVAFVPAGYDPGNWMLQVPDFNYNFHRATTACGSNANWTTLDTAVWPTTQGHAWRSSYFYTFMNFISPALPLIEDYQFGGHIAERLLTVYTSLTHPPQYLTGLFTHQSMDVHGTGALMRGDMATFAEKTATFGL